jgi:hypothetical protein
MPAHPDIRGRPFAQGVLNDPRSSDHTLRAALADMLRNNASMRASWTAETAELRKANMTFAEMTGERLGPNRA